jgi:hypothetical protein
MDDLSYESCLGLKNLRSLVIIYNRSHLGEGHCVVEYVGGWIEISYVDRYPIKQLPERFGHREG